jgi:Thioesterase-like superfamily/Alpha/beta hydrolase family
MRTLVPADRQLVSVGGRFIRPLTWPILVDADVVRNGGTLTIACATASSESGTCVEANATFSAGAARPAQVFAPPMPTGIADRASAAIVEIPPEFVPISQRMEIRAATPELPYSGAAKPVLCGWIRLTDEVPATEERIPILIDSLAPSYTALLTELRAVPTVEMSIQLSADAPESAFDWVLVLATTTSADAHGFVQPTVLALHGWGSGSTAMSSVVQAAVACGEPTMCFDAPGHGVSPGSHATITVYARASQEVLQRFPSIHTIIAHSLASLAAIAAVARRGAPWPRSVLLIAPACSLSLVLDRWAAQRRLPSGVVTLIDRELERRDGVPVSHWDIRKLGVPDSVQLRIVHDPADDVVPFSDAVLIASATTADLREAQAGTGHYGIIGSDAMRAALTASLQAPVDHER